MGFSYLILGSGRQGIAAAYDLGKFGDAERVTLADVSREVAERAADRVNLLLGGRIADRFDSGSGAGEQSLRTEMRALLELFHSRG